MSSEIMVYGHNQTELDWMRSNYQAAYKRFTEIHPTFESEDGKFDHGIGVMGSSSEKVLKYQYYWDIACHWDYDKHLRQTESDIKTILKELNSPEGIEVYLSPNVD